MANSNSRFFFGWDVGGRQVDGAIGSFSALERITASSRVRHAQEQGKFTVLFDSGIRTGSDVIKAIAMGAQAVLGEQGIHWAAVGCFETDVATGTSFLAPSY